jgi:acyl-coenzyme A synthetase/AMP-(fatty) acid ligase
VTVIAAFVVPADGAPHDGDAIKTFAADLLAAYKVPREIVFVDKLPRTPNGKIQRKALSLPSPVERDR